MFIKQTRRHSTHYQHYNQLLLVCSSFQRDFYVEEGNNQMYIFIICWEKMKCDLVDLLDILLGLEHTSQSGYFKKSFFLKWWRLSN